MKLRTCVVFSLAVILCCATTVSAGSISLGELIDSNGSVQVGDKLFDDFGYDATGDMPDAADVNVVDRVDLDGNNGLRFQGAFFDFPGGGGSNALITYRVTVLDPDRLISDAHLAGNPDVIGGAGLMSVSEAFAPDAPNAMSIFEDANGAQNVDWTFFDTPLRELHVEKRIVAFAEVGAVATMSFIDQTFSQITIPEPATLSLLVFLGLGVVLMRRRLG